MGAQRRGGIDSIKEKRGKGEREREEKMEFCFSINERCLRCQRDVA